MDNVTFLHDDCVRCGKPVEVIAPSLAYLLLTIDGVRTEWLHDPSGEAHCVACALEFTPDKDRPRLEAKLNAYQQRKTIIGLPDDVTLYYAPMKSEGVQGDQFLARVSGNVPESWTIPRLYLTPDDPDENAAKYLFMAWDFATPDRKAQARYTWLADRPEQEGHVWITGWSQVPGETLAELMKTSKRFVMEAQQRGRREGRDHSRDDILAAHKTFYDKTGRWSSQSEVAAELDTTTRTIRRTLAPETWADFTKKARHQTFSRIVRSKAPR